MRSSAARAYTVLFFLSGATGLIYELLWVRLLYQAFGSTIQSVTTVVAAYMGGLGLGAWLLGRRADRHLRPAALYGWLELAVGGFALLSPLLLALVHRAYVSAAGAWQLGGGASVALRDRKSTRLNSSHLVISYAVFCLKKKKTDRATHSTTSTHAIRRNNT